MTKSRFLVAKSRCVVSPQVAEETYSLQASLDFGADSDEDVKPPLEGMDPQSQGDRELAAKLNGLNKNLQSMGGKMTKVNRDLGRVQQEQQDLIKNKNKLTELEIKECIDEIPEEERAAMATMIKTSFTDLNLLKMGFASAVRRHE